MAAGWANLMDSSPQAMGAAIFIGEAPFRPFADNRSATITIQRDIDAAAATFRSVCTRGPKPPVPATERIWVDRVRDTPLQPLRAYRDRHGKLRQLSARRPHGAVAAAQRTWISGGGRPS